MNGCDGTSVALGPAGRWGGHEWGSHPDSGPARRPELQRGGTASPNQIKAIYGLCRRKRLDPQKLVHERFDRYVVEDLTIREASELLDELKQDMPLARPTA